MNGLQANFQSIRILHLAMTAGLVLMGGVFFFFFPEGFADGKSELNGLFQALVPALLMGALGFGEYKMRQPFEFGETAQTGAEKLGHYRTRLIMCLAFVEAGALMSAIAFLITGRTMYLLGIAVAVVWMLLHSPTPAMISAQLDLSAAERAEIEG